MITYITNENWGTPKLRPRFEAMQELKKDWPHRTPVSYSFFIEKRFSKIFTDIPGAKNDPTDIKVDRVYFKALEKGKISICEGIHIKYPRYHDLLNVMLDSGIVEGYISRIK